MREIVLDTETTGLDPTKGDRVVEIGAVEMINHLPTANHFHCYINPERLVPEEVVAIHGLTDEFLRDKPVFADITQGFIDFIGDSRLIIHNAAFDIRFLNHELGLVGREPLAWGRVLDTLALAREKLPGAACSLDALCQRFGVDNSGRELHGALLDSQLLAEVYLELLGGRQTSISFERATQAAGSGQVTPEQQSPRQVRPTPLPSRLSPVEAAAHREFVEKMGTDAIWLRSGDG